MQLRSIVLIAILAFTLFQERERHSPTVQKTCTPGVSFWKLFDEIREKTDPMIYIVDYLSGGRYTSWWIEKRP